MEETFLWGSYLSARAARIMDCGGRGEEEKGSEQMINEGTNYEP